MDIIHTGVNSSISMYCATDEGNIRNEESERYERSELNEVNQ
jgi:hypothetical protein